LRGVVDCRLVCGTERERERLEVGVSVDYTSWVVQCLYRRMDVSSRVYDERYERVRKCSEVKTV
jgi:hypothetical protein